MACRKLCVYFCAKTEEFPEGRRFETTCDGKAACPGTYQGCPLQSETFIKADNSKGAAGAVGGAAIGTAAVVGTASAVGAAVAGSSVAGAATAGAVAGAFAGPVGIIVGLGVGAAIGWWLFHEPPCP